MLVRLMVRPAPGHQVRMPRLLWITALLVLAAMPAAAGIYDGIVAYKRGDYRIAFGQLMPAAKAGHPVAQYYVARMRDDGHGVTRDQGKAADWYRKAAERGHADAQYRLGMLYLWGRGVPQSRADALRWHLRAAGQGHVPAQASVGSLYARGAEGVGQNSIRAWMWLTIAARAGSHRAALSLDGVEQEMTASELAKAKGLVMKFRAAPE